MNFAQALLQRLGLGANHAADDADFDRRLAHIGARETHRQVKTGPFRPALSHPEV